MYNVSSYGILGQSNVIPEATWNLVVLQGEGAANHGSWYYSHEIGPSENTFQGAIP